MTNSSLNTRLETFLFPLSSIYISIKVTDTSSTQHEVIYTFILADPVYPSISRIISTFKTTQCIRCPLTKRFNYKLTSIRYYIENAFDICKDRFRLLNYPLEYAKDNVVRVIKLISVIFTLNNFLIDVNDSIDIESEEVEDRDILDNDDDEEIDEDDEFSIKDILLQHMR